MPAAGRFSHASITFGLVCPSRRIWVRDALTAFGLLDHGDSLYRHRADSIGGDTAISTQKHVAVLMGGWSAEREVSLRSGKACADALSRLGYGVTGIDDTRANAAVRGD